MFSIPAFECCDNNSHYKMLNVVSIHSCPNNADFSRLRVNAHYEPTSATDVVINCVSKFLTNHRIEHNLWKSLTKKLLNHQSSLTQRIAKKLASLKHHASTFVQCRNFQEINCDYDGIPVKWENKKLILGASLRD